MPTYQQQNKSVLNLFAGLLQWAFNNPLQAIVALAALQVSIAQARSSEEAKYSPRKLARPVTTAQDDIFGMTSHSYDFSSALLSNNRSVLAYGLKTTVDGTDVCNVQIQLFSADYQKFGSPITVHASECNMGYHSSKIAALNNGAFALLYPNHPSSGTSYVNFKKFSALGIPQGSAIQLPITAQYNDVGMDLEMLSNGNIAIMGLKESINSIMVIDQNGNIVSTRNDIFSSGGTTQRIAMAKIADNRYVLSASISFYDTSYGSAHNYHNNKMYYKIFDETFSSAIFTGVFDIDYTLPQFYGRSFDIVPMANGGFAMAFIDYLGYYNNKVHCFDHNYAAMNSYTYGSTGNDINIAALSNGGFIVVFSDSAGEEMWQSASPAARIYNQNCQHTSTIVLGNGGGLYHLITPTPVTDQYQIFWQRAYVNSENIRRQVYTFTNSPVQLNNSIPLQVIRSRTSTSYVVPANTFSDADVDQTLAYSATMADGSALPDWLGFDASTKTLIGFPEDSNIGVYSLKVTGTDIEGSSAISPMTLQVKRFNRAPVAALPLPNRSAKVGLPFSTTISGSAFTDADGDVISYNATRPDNSTLPAWLSLNNSTRQFTGTPPSAGSLGVKVKAYDDYDGEVTSQFNINIAESLAATIPSSGQYIQNQGYSFSGFSINSEASSSVTLKLTLSDSEAGSLSTPSSGAAVSSYNAATGVWTVTGTSSEVQSIANQVQFVPVNGYSDPLIISALVDDGVNTPVSNNLSLTAQAPSASATATATTTNTPSATGTAISTTTVTGSPSVTASAAGTASAAPTPLGTATAQPSFNAQVPASPSPLVEVSASVSPSGQASASPNSGLDTSNSGTSNTGGLSGSMITSIAGSVGGAVAAGLIGLVFRQYSANKEAAKHREEHPFANFLRSELNLNVNDFKSKSGVAYVTTIKLLANEFEKNGLKVSDFTPEEFHVLTPIVAEAVRARLALSSNCSGKTVIPSMLALKNILADIAKESTAKYRAKAAQTFGTVTPIYSNPIGGAANDPRASRVFAAGAMV